MTDVTLIQAQPRFASTGALVDVRLAGGGSKAYTQLGFGDWRSGIANLPRFATEIGYGKEGLTGGALPQTAGFQFSPSDRSYFTALANIIWDGARVIVSSGDDEAIVPSYRQRLIGTVASVRTSGASVTFTIADLSLDLDKPVCPNTFAGTGGLEGIDEAAGRIKRRTYGRVFNVEGRLLDKANSIYEFGDPAFPLDSFDMVKDKGVAGPIKVVQWQGSAGNTLTALRAATPPTSGAAVAPSIACAKWFTTPAGPLTADITGTYGAAGRAPAALAKTIAESGASSIAVDDPTVAIGWIPFDSGIHCDTASETFGNLLDRLLLPVFIAWVLDGTGVLRFRRLTWDGPVETLIAVQPIAREDILPAIKGRKLGFQKNHRQQNDGEISVTLLSSTDVTYADGTPIEALKPAEAGANITEQRTANAISGQGSLATLSTLDRTGGYLTGFGDLSGLANLYFGSPYLLEQSGGASASLSNFKTALGNALGIVNQGLLATLSAIGYDSSYLTGLPNGIKPSNFLSGGYFDAAWGRYGANGEAIQSLKPGEVGANVTEKRNALGFAGQGLLATLNAIGDGYLSGNLATRLAPWGSDARYLNASAVAFAAGNTIEGLKPGEAGANITENRNALGFQGQGALATLAFVQFGSSRTVTTADGTTVTDNLVVTAAGVSLGFQGQAALATKDQTGYYDIKLGDLTSASGATMNNPDVSYQAPFSPTGIYPVPGLSGSLNVKPNGVFYAIFSGANRTTGGYPEGAYTSIQFLDGAGNVFVDRRISLSVGADAGGDLAGMTLLFVNPRSNVETVNWRIVVRSATNPNGGVTSATAVQRMSVQTFWKAI